LCHSVVRIKSVFDTGGSLIEFEKQYYQKLSSL
jgi:hypothetical protein